MALLATCFMLVSYLAYNSTLKMEAICLCEASVDFQLNTGYYTPEIRILPLLYFETIYLKVPLTKFSYVYRLSFFIYYTVSTIIVLYILILKFIDREYKD